MKVSQSVVRTQAVSDLDNGLVTYKNASWLGKGHRCQEYEVSVKITVKQCEMNVKYLSNECKLSCN